MLRLPFLRRKSPELALCVGLPVTLEGPGLGRNRTSRQEVIMALGPPSKSEPAQIVYSHEGKLADGFDETAWLILGFGEDRLVSMRGGKTTTN